MMNQIYLLFGESKDKIKLEEMNIIEETNSSDFNISYFDFEEGELEDALRDAISMPFLDNYRVIILKNAKFLDSAKGVDEVGNLLSYINNPSLTTVFIIEAPYLKIDTRKTIAKELLKVAKTIECQLETKEEIERIARKYVSDHKIMITNEALFLLCEKVKNTANYALELNKLSIFYSGKRIESKDIELLITDSDDDKIYDLTGAIVSKERKKALDLYYSFVKKGMNPTALLSSIASKFQEILYVKELLREGSKQEDVMSYFNVTRGKAYYMIKNAKEVSDKLIKRYINTLSLMDYNIKSGNATDLSLELFILRL